MEMTGKTDLNFDKVNGSNRLLRRKVVVERALITLTRPLGRIWYYVIWRASVVVSGSRDWRLPDAEAHWKARSSKVVGAVTTTR